MKILYIGTPTNSDFMSDCLFHGLRTLLGSDIVDCVKIDYMYDTFPKEHLTRFHGSGFTLARKLPDISVDRTDLLQKIRNQYFDYVIYGASFREYALDFLEPVIRQYPPHKIVFVNGSDSERGTIEPSLIPYNGIHFLREKFTNNSAHPISFSIPQEIIVKDIPKKEYYLMPLVPGVGMTYIYPDEQSYYQAYRQSLFGLTWKKAGWDCLRHYEILSQGCLPLFLDIAHIPELVMTNYPKKQVELLLDIAVKINGYKKDMKFHYDDRITITDIDFSSIEFMDPDSYGYYDIVSELLDYTRNFLTTEYQAKYLLDTIRQYQ